MSDFNYIEIPFKEFRDIEENYNRFCTVFDGEQTVYRTFVKGNDKIELKYEYLYDEEYGNYYIVYRKISVSN